MTFDHREADDIIIAVPHWNVDSLLDVEIWYQQWERYLMPFCRKMDVVIILDNFEVNVEVASEWGKRRAEVNNKYIRYGYRVNSKMQVSTFIKTSGIRYQAATAEAPTLEDAIAEILLQRQKWGTDAVGTNFAPPVK